MQKSILFLLLFIAVLISGCTTTNYSADPNAKPVILTTFYPVEEITKAIVQDTAEVKVLVGAGVEPHSFEPTPSQIVELSKADIFVTMEGMFESVESSIISSNKNIKVIDSAHNVEKIKGEEHHDDHGEEHQEESHDEHEDHEDHSDQEDHDHGDYDPHIWLSIHNMQAMTEEVLEQLVEKYPENKELYEANAKAYLEKLEQLEQEFETKLASCEHSEIIVNHKAFGYLGHEYKFEQISVAGFSPKSEPTPRTISRVVDEAKEHNLKYVFSEGQIDPKIAQTIADDIGGEVLELNPIKLNTNEDYFSIMRANLDNLATGLNCQS